MPNQYSFNSDHTKKLSLYGDKEKNQNLRIELKKFDLSERAIFDLLIFMEYRQLHTIKEMFVILTDTQKFGLCKLTNQFYARDPLREDGFDIVSIDKDIRDFLNAEKEKLSRIRAAHKRGAVIAVLAHLKRPEDAKPLPVKVVNHISSFFTKQDVVSIVLSHKNASMQAKESVANEKMMGQNAMK